jgi:hypothetical protein
MSFLRVKQLSRWTWVPLPGELATVAECDQAIEALARLDSHPKPPKRRPKPPPPKALEAWQGPCPPRLVCPKHFYVTARAGVARCLRCGAETTWNDPRLSVGA